MGNFAGINFREGFFSNFVMLLIFNDSPKSYQRLLLRRIILISSHSIQTHSK